MLCIPSYSVCSSSPAALPQFAFDARFLVPITASTGPGLCADVAHSFAMQLDMSVLTSRMSQSRTWLSRLPASRSLLLGLDAFPLPAVDFCPRLHGAQLVQQHSSASAAAFSKALLRKEALRPRVQAQATALELDEIEILAGPNEVAAESARKGPFDQLGCDDRVTVSPPQVVSRLRLLHDQPRAALNKR